MPAVSVKGVSKKYRIYPSGRTRLKEALSFGRKSYGRDFWALEDVSLEVEPGISLGILGRNGAGKSTLLSIIAGIRQPTSGTVEVNGRLVALFGLGAGFNPEFTGRENVMLNGLILGLEYGEMLERFDDIAALADIGDFMDQPIKTYSSGMRSRLGFAVAVNVEPDVLVVDETLAVGDAVFKETALQKMYDLRDSGTTILFVSHSIGMVQNFCTRAVLLHKGRTVAEGETGEVIERYQALVSKVKAHKKGQQEDDEQAPEAGITVPDEEAENLPFREDSSFGRRQAALPRGGTGEVKIRSVELLDEQLRPTGETTVAFGSSVTVRANLEYLEAVKESEINIALRDEAGLEVFSVDTALRGVAPGEMEKDERVAVDFTFEVPLRHGLYGITAAVRAGSEELDRVDAAATFEVSQPRDRNPLRGIVHLPVEIEVHAPEGERQGRSA